MLKNDNILLFLSQSYLESFDIYRDSLNASNNVWDYVILTASNDEQAKAYEAQIAYRQQASVLPKHTKFGVVADPDGKRCGSGGATLAVLRYIAASEGTTDLSKLRILCIHSGGDSKRVPQYSACGKIFSSVPRVLPDGRRSTLFDEFLIGVAGIPSRISSGMLVCSGDVLLLFNALQLDFFGEGAAALTIKENVVTGQNHGVFLMGEDGKVKRCLQKQSQKTLREVGAVDSFDNVDIDTGAVILSGGMVNALLGMVSTEEAFRQYCNDRVRLSFYADFLYPLASDSTREQFYLEKPEGEYSDALTEAERVVWNTLRPFSMKLVRFSPAAFLHFGTVAESRNLVTADIDRYRFLGWADKVHTNDTTSGYAVYNSYIHADARIGDGCQIENADIGADVEIGRGSVISALALNHVVVPSEVLLHGLRLNDGRFVCRMIGIGDNPKEKNWLGQTLSQPLWTTPLFPVRNSMEEAVRATLNHDRTGELLSLQESFQRADVTAILPWQDKIAAKVVAESILQQIAERVSAETVKNKYPSGISERVERYLLQAAEETDIALSSQIRILFYLYRLTGKDGYASRGFAQIRTNAFAAIGIETRFDRIKKEEVEVALPARVNFGGGWSDTPPYCNEHGGAVLNAAIQINGINPIRTRVRKIAEHRIILSSSDIGSYREFDDIVELRHCDDPSDAFALHKAALLSCGIIPQNGGDLKKICEKLGGGLAINTEVVGIPKGSGLGTSSILSASCVSALSELFGVGLSASEISDRVLVMEQLMSTGGGWQDQLGGLLPGLKLLTSRPGKKQTVNATRIVLEKETAKELNERFALIYTGQRRLARNLLRDVVAKYLCNDFESDAILTRIQQLAVLMRFELERGDVDAFAELLNQHWELQKRLDAGCTNICIDQILRSVDDLVDGRMICGGGGGGFLQVILKKDVTHKQLHDRLLEVFGGAGVGVWDTRLLFR